MFNVFESRRPWAKDTKLATLETIGAAIDWLKSNRIILYVAYDPDDANAADAIDKFGQTYTIEQVK